MKTIAKKLSLKVAPTFVAAVTIQTPGGGEGVINVTFKHRTKDQVKEFVDHLNPPEAGPNEPKAPAVQDIDVLLDIASGWDLDEPFDKTSLEVLTQNHLGAVQAFIGTYLTELTGARTKN